MLTDALLVVILHTPISNAVDMFVELAFQGRTLFRGIEPAGGAGLQGPNYVDQGSRLGQQRLKASSVICVGAGGLGSPLLMYLAAAGVGRIGIVDFDVVDASNLHRQVIHGTPQVGVKKVHSAAQRIHDINPNVQVDIFDIRLTAKNALEIFKPYDIVVEIEAETLTDLPPILSDSIRTLDGIQSTTSLVAFPADGSTGA